MQKYKYTAVNVNKKKFTGVFLADNVNELKSQLAKQGLYLTSSKVVKNSKPSWALSLSGKIPIKDLTTFARQFAIMINAGISIVDSIGSLKSQPYSQFFCQSLSIIHEDLNAGIMLSDAMKKQKSAYPEFFISMVYIGESSGSLDEILVNLADYYENDMAIKSKTKSAFVYPGVLLALMIGVIALMMLFVIPTFQKSLADLEVQMPKLTQIVFDLSNKVVDNILSIVITIVSIILALVIFGKTKIGKYVYDMLKFYLPLIKKVQ